MNRVPSGSRPPARGRPGLTACSLCAGETLGSDDPLDGGQLARLRRIEACGTARLTLSECLDECERGDVVVARPSPAGRRKRATPVWFERLAGEELTAELTDWLAEGGPGEAEVPERLRGLVIDRPVPGSAPTTVLDLVCGMKVDPSRAPASVEHAGSQYYFCAKGCARAFAAEPARYLTS